MTSAILQLIPSAITIVFSFYGCFHFISEVFTSFIPFGTLLVGTIVFAIYALRVPPPPKEAVEAIIGKDLLDNEDQEGYVLKTVAHRGAGLDAPENSLAAFDLCHASGCDFIEFDVTLTSDGIPVVFHDSTLERMADSNVVVSQTAYEVLKDIDISVKHPLRDRFGVTNIPTLDQTVIKLLRNGQKMIIDIKDNSTKMVPVILDLFVRYPNLYSNAFVTSFFPNIIYLVRRTDPKIVCSLGYRPHMFASQSFKYPVGQGPNRATQFWKTQFFAFCDILHTWAISRITYYVLGIPVILLQKDCISPEIILKWRSKGVRVMAWTVNSPTEKQHISRNLKITYLTDTLTGELSAHSSC
ncbi:glycerophosphodiester phosphodiesterase 1 [Anthonomus grandis grandis]|uniref:glycerophosphodiester phosphodiesterase 1 n=1 Tax=Anthonomus grandis grandis TaxID=2921223 RepID=UPI002166BD3E|nr:glycerophosphodiester phosphodiesterase 1 [Anthonomus grandis grandis]